MDNEIIEKINNKQRGYMEAVIKAVTFKSLMR